MSFWTEKATKVEGGTLVRYTVTERKGGFWSGHGTVERVRWRAEPDDRTQPVTKHRLRRDALAALKSTGIWMVTDDLRRIAHEIFRANFDELRKVSEELGEE